MVVYHFVFFHNKVKYINQTHSKKKVNSLGGPGVVESGVLLRHWQKRQLVCNESLIESCPICGALSDLSGFFALANYVMKLTKVLPYADLMMNDAVSATVKCNIVTAVKVNVLNTR